MLGGCLGLVSRSPFISISLGVNKFYQNGVQLGAEMEILTKNSSLITFWLKLLAFVR